MLRTWAYALVGVLLLAGSTYAVGHVSTAAPFSFQLAQAVQPDLGTANKQCPPANGKTTEYAGRDKPKFRLPWFGPRIWNLSWRTCVTVQQDVEVVEGHCVAEDVCRAESYIGEDSKKHGLEDPKVAGCDTFSCRVSKMFSIGAQASPVLKDQGVPTGGLGQGQGIGQAFNNDTGGGSNPYEAVSSKAASVSQSPPRSVPQPDQVPSGGPVTSPSPSPPGPSPYSKTFQNVSSLTPGSAPVSPTLALGPTGGGGISPSSVPSIPYAPSPAQTRGFAPTPSYTPRRDTSFFSFIPDFSPSILFNNVIRVAQNTVQPIITRIIIGGSTPAPLSIPGSPSRRSAPVTVIIPSADSSATLVISAPTIKDIIANVREQENSATSRAPDTKVNVSRLSDAQILQLYLDLESASPSVAVLQPGTSRGSESALSNTSVLDAAFSQSKNPASLRAAPQQITLFAPTSFSEENSLAPRVGSAVERGHPVSIVDLWSAILSGSFTRVREVLAAGRPEPPVSGEPRGDKATSPEQPQSVSEQSEPHRGETLVPASPLPPQLPPLPTTLWSPNFQAPPASAGISFTTSPTPVPRIGRSAKTEVEASSTSTAEAPPPPTFLGKVGNAFGKILAWFSSPFLVPQSTSMSAGHSGSATVRLLADPPKAVRGAKTTLYWTSTGIDACTIFAPDDSEIGRGVEGTTLTPTLTKPAVFTARCFAGSSVVTAAVTVGIQ